MGLQQIKELKEEYRDIKEELKDIRNIDLGLPNISVISINKEKKLVYNLNLNINEIADKYEIGIKNK